MSGDWAGRAGTVEEVIRRRFVRRLAGVVPGTRIGRVRWPRPLPIRPWPWQLLVAGPPAGLPGRRARAERPSRGGRWRSPRWPARCGCATSAPGPTTTTTTSPGSAWRYSAPGHWPAAPRRPRSPRSPPGSARDGRPAGGGGIWWRRGDDFKNAPANGPAAILAARTGDLEFATTITDWIAATLVDPNRPGPRRGPAQPGRDRSAPSKPPPHLPPRRVSGGVRGAGRTRR